MCAISFGLVLIISLVTNCHSYKNITSDEQSDYKYFKSLAADTHGGLGVEYVRHQIAKHGSWYHHKEYERTKIFQTSKLQTKVDAKQYSPFNLHDIGDDYRDQMLGIGIGLEMLKNAENYSDATEIKSADSALYLNLKLRPSKSELIPSHKYTKTEIENMLVANGTTLFLESVRRLNPERFKNLTSNQIADIQSIKIGSNLSENVTRISANLTKSALHNNQLAAFKPVPLLIRPINMGSSLHRTSILLIILILVTVQNVQNCV